MKKFIIAIEETVVDEFEIEAKNAQEAMKLAEKLYIKGKIVLAPGDVTFKQMSIVKPAEEATKWIEF